MPFTQQSYFHVECDAPDCDEGKGIECCDFWIAVDVFISSKWRFFANDMRSDPWEWTWYCPNHAKNADEASQDRAGGSV